MLFIVTSAALGIATLPFQSALTLMLGVLVVPILAGFVAGWDWGRRALPARRDVMLTAGIFSLSYLLPALFLLTISQLAMAQWKDRNLEAMLNESTAFLVNVMAGAPAVVLILLLPLLLWLALRFGIRQAARRR
ncbi:hypothetical protein [Paracoccus sp. (in: a-proteobacteria)]|uniref:hypothetical protein n=1 Tax=Paracoccus sp. TaxID=267 RepID=UPI0026E10E8D|nr:hypothetical protein [Paracoccus sp. (in: a-proteobacteria)]